MEGIGIYTLGKSIDEFQEGELIEFSKFDYDTILRTYGIRRQFPNEVFYTATNKGFLGYEATEAFVSVLHKSIYKVTFDIVHISGEEREEFLKKTLAYVKDCYGDPTEIRELPNGVRLTIWDRDFGNLIIHDDYIHA